MPLLSFDWKDEMRKINRAIYRLWHSRSIKGKIGYIGKDSHYPSRLNLNARINDKKCRKLYNALRKYPIDIWKKEFLASGFKSEKSLNRAEMFYIKKFDSKNRGYNCTDGGEGSVGLVFSEESRKKMSEAQSGKKAHNWGKKFSAETRAKMRKACKKRVPMSDETKKKISESLSGENNPNRGRKAPLETRRKQSEAAKGNKSNLGKKFSPEHKLGIAKAQKTTWDNYSTEERKERGKAMSRGWKKRLKKIKEDGR